MRQKIPSCIFSLSLSLVSSIKNFPPLIIYILNVNETNKKKSYPLSIEKHGTGIVNENVTSEGNCKKDERRRKVSRGGWREKSRCIDFCFSTFPFPTIYLYGNPVFFFHFNFIVDILSRNILKTNKIINSKIFNLIT